MKFPTPSLIKISEQLRLSMIDVGPKDAQPIVFLHGLTDSWRSFEPLLPYLPTDYRSIAITQRGHGDADRPLSGYATRDFEEDLRLVLDRLGIDQAIVVGHSMGAANALRFSIDNPDKVRGLVLIGAFATFKNNPVVVDFYETGIKSLRDPIPVEFAREFQESTIFNPISPTFLETVIGESLKVPARVWRDAARGLMDDDFVDDLEMVEAPTLILWGDRDVFSPRQDQETLVARIPNATLRVFEDVGHGVHWERPERVASDIKLFCHSVFEMTRISINTKRS